MDLDTWLVFLPAAVLVAASPGANNFLALAWIIHEARWKGHPAGFPAVITIAAIPAMPKARE